MPPVLSRCKQTNVVKRALQNFLLLGEMEKAPFVEKQNHMTWSLLMGRREVSQEDAQTEGVHLVSGDNTHK